MGATLPAGFARVCQPIGATCQLLLVLIKSGVRVFDGMRGYDRARDLIKMNALNCMELRETSWRSDESQTILFV